MLHWIFIMLIGFSVLDYVRKHSIFTPVFIYNLIWLITLGLYQLKLSYLQSDLNDDTIKVFFIAVMAYNIASIVFSIFKFKKKKPVEKDSSDKKITIARTIVIIVFIIETIYSGGIPLLWRLLGDSRTYFDYGIPSLHGAFNGLIICLGAYSIYKKRKDSFLYIGIGILTLSRQVIISMFIEAIVCMGIGSTKKLKKETRRKIIKYGIIILLLFTVLGNFRSGNDAMNNVFKPKKEYENISTTSKWVYSYLTFSISNFNKLTTITPGNINKGASMMYEIVPTVLLKKANIVVEYQPYYLVSPNYNVSTYLPSIYLDFGINGVAYFSIFIAFLGSILYTRFSANKNIRNKMLYSVFVHNILLMFFNNMFLYLPVIVQFIYIPIIFKNTEDDIL